MYRIIAKLPHPVQKQGFDAVSIFPSLRQQTGSYSSVQKQIGLKPSAGDIVMTKTIVTATRPHLDIIVTSAGQLKYPKWLSKSLPSSPNPTGIVRLRQGSKRFLYIRELDTEARCLVDRRPQAMVVFIQKLRDEMQSGLSRHVAFEHAAEICRDVVQYHNRKDAFP